MSLSYFEEMIETSDKTKRNLELLTDSNLFLLNIGSEKEPTDIELQFIFTEQEAKKFYQAFHDIMYYLGWSK